MTATPSVSPDGYIFVCSGHTGSRALGHVTRTKDEWHCETIFSDPSDSHLHGFIGQGHGYTTGAAWWDGAFYMAAPEGLQCLLPDGSIAWRERCMAGKDRGSPVAAGLASVTVVNGRLLTVTLAGDLLIAAAEPKGYSELARIKMGAPSRALLAYSAGRVVNFSARSNAVVCVDLGAKKP